MKGDFNPGVAGVFRGWTRSCSSLRCFGTASHRVVAVLFVLISFSLPARAEAPKEGARVQPEVIEALLPPHIGAAVLAIDEGEVVFRHAWGVRRAGGPEPVTPTTNFRLASVSKHFTATAVLTLVDRGDLKLTDTLDTFFADAPDYWREITVHHLLTHTSGLPDYEPRVPEHTTLQLSDYNVLSMLLATDAPKFVPGSAYDYSNSAFTLLGLIVERVSGRPFHVYMREAVLEPAGMTNSVCYLAGMNDVADRAYGHDLEDDGTWAVADQSVTSAIRGDGSMYSSLDDLAKWVAAWDAGTPLKPATHAAMFTRHVKSTRGDADYGYGWFLDEVHGTPRVWHSGSTQGFSLMLQRFPQRRAAVVILLNRSPADTATEDANRIADRLLFTPAGDAD